MKKKIIILLLVTNMLLLCGCKIPAVGYFVRMAELALYEVSEDAKADKVLKNLLQAVSANDKQAVKSMFSGKVDTESESFNESMDKLFEYYEGELVSYDRDPSYSEHQVHYGEESLYMNTSYDIKTTVRDYRLYFGVSIVDDFNPENEGIDFLYIIRTEDDINPNDSCAGDGEKTPGINIGCVYEWYI